MTHRPAAVGALQRSRVLPVLVITVVALAMAAANIDAWRLGSEDLAVLVNLQGLYALVPFAVSAGLAHGDWRRGALLGGCQGAASIAGYYAWSWLVHGEHSATSQLAGLGTPFWLAGATAGGVVFGVLGAAAARQGRGATLAWGLVGGLLLAEAGTMWLDPGDRFATDGPSLAAGVLVAGGLTLAVLGWRRHRPAVTRPAVSWLGLSWLGLGLALGAAGYAALVLAEHRFAYPTL